jgi:hypothetical protein
MAQTYENDLTDVQYALELRRRADFARIELNARGEGALPVGGETDAQEEELMDALVAGYFR